MKKVQPPEQNKSCVRCRFYELGLDVVDIAFQASGRHKGDERKLAR